MVVEMQLADTAKYPERFQRSLFGFGEETHRTLLDGEMVPGSYSAQFSGVGYTSGVYFYRLEGAGMSKTGKMVLMK